MDDLLTSYISLMVATMNKQKKAEQQHGASFRKGTPATMNKQKPVKVEQQLDDKESFRKGAPVRRGSRKY